MTTITLQGIRLDFVNGDPHEIGTAEAVITVPDSATTFSYSLTGEEDEGVPSIEIEDESYHVMLDGHSTHELDESGHMTTFAASVTWSEGTTTIIGVNFSTGDFTDSDIYFVLDGPVPDFSSISAWEAFDNSITGFGTPTGAFAPGQDIAWTEFDHYSVSEDDEFHGSEGRDVFHGGIGDDYFRSSDGRDTYDGGQGIDQVTFNEDPNGVTVNLKTGEATDGWGKTDTLNSIEMLRGSAHDDGFTGNGGRNIFRGLAGEDMMDGAGGRDQVRYDRDDRYGGDEGVTVKLHKGFAIDGFGDRDSLRHIEDVRGSDHRDSITGSGGRNALEGENGNDRLFGLNGNDTLSGGGGKDKLDGGGGDDVLNGDGGYDCFVFRGAFGNDTVSDFHTAGRKEKIDLSDVSPIKSFRDLKNNHLSENADGDAVISDNRGNSITLEDVAMSDLSGNDFLF
ncbi:hypothetical protein [Cribrihabitans neustonicus]|uniref:hypothetical protein n=1 Tax=Cribrihabitans neustonicus TaxID=1429085 RepID=UPI003B5A2577